jgi:hypothetical protein
MLTPDRESGSRDVVGVDSRGFLHITRHVKQDNQPPARPRPSPPTRPRAPLALARDFSSSL